MEERKSYKTRQVISIATENIPIGTRGLAIADIVDPGNSEIIASIILWENTNYPCFTGMHKFHVISEGDSIKLNPIQKQLMDAYSVFDEHGILRYY